MAWPKKPHFKGDALKRTMEQTLALPPSPPVLRNIAIAAKRASDDLVIGTMIEAIDMAYDQRRPDRMVQAASELGKLRGMYIERHQSQSEVLYRIPALEAMSLEELRALAQLPDAPQPHHEAAPVLPDTTDAT